jgi:signal transduction histidine kinase
MKKPGDEQRRLRNRAEDKRVSLQQRDLLRFLPHIDEKSLVYELQVHQIELELQNDELKRIQAELEESRNRFVDLYDLAPVGYLTLDTFGMILEANLTAAAQLNMLRGDLVGRHFQSFMDRSGADNFHLFLRKSLKPREKAVLEYRLLPAKGMPSEFALTLAGEFSHTGRLVRYRVILADVSTIRKLERQVSETGEKLRSLTSELNLAEEHARRAIAQTLHDAISQTLAMARMKLSSMAHPGDTNAEKTVEEVLDLLASVLDESRTLMAEISPPVLHELGLGAGIDWIAEKMSLQHGIAIKTRKAGDFTDLGQDEKIMLYQMVRELLTNVVKHSEARSCEVSIKRINRSVSVTVWDDGQGFDAKGPAWKGFGLFGIRERLKAYDGTLNIDSAPGRGTAAIILLPVEKKERAKA